MRILGIDPGTRVVGYGCIELPERPEPRGGGIRNSVSIRFGVAHLHLCGAGVLRLGTGSLEARLCRLAGGLEVLIREWVPGRIALEEAFFGKSVQSALRIGEARGVVLLTACRLGCPVVQYAPATVKLKVAGRGGASKEALARMVAASLGPGVEGLGRDATDALALALCHAQDLSGTTLVGGNPPKRGERPCETPLSRENPIRFQGGWIQKRD